MNALPQLSSLSSILISLFSRRPSTLNLLGMSAAENVSLGFLFFPCQVRRMLYCVTVFVVVKTKDKKTKMDISSQLGCPRFLFSLKCLVKPHRIGFVTPLQRCCSAFSTASATTCYQLPALVLGKSRFIFLNIISPFTHLT